MSRYSEDKSVSGESVLRSESVALTLAAASSSAASDVLVVQSAPDDVSIATEVRLAEAHAALAKAEAKLAVESGHDAPLKSESDTSPTGHSGDGEIKQDDSQKIHVLSGSEPLVHIDFIPSKQESSSSLISSDLSHPSMDDSLLHIRDITKSRAEAAFRAYAQARDVAEASLYAYVEAYNYNAQLKALKEHITQASSAKPESADELQGVYDAAMAEILSAKPEEGFDGSLSHAFDSYVRAEAEASLAYYAKAKAEIDVKVSEALLNAAYAKSEDIAETYKASANAIAHFDWIEAAKAEIEANAEERLDVINQALPETESFHILSKVQAAVAKALASSWARVCKLAKADASAMTVTETEDDATEDEAIIDRAKAHASATDSVEGDARVMDDDALAAAVYSALKGLSGHHEDHQDFFA